MKLQLKSIQRDSRLPERVASLILKEITEGRIKAGERLPTERALSHTLGVSRNVVREAIAGLQSEGIVEARQGVGAFVLKCGRSIGAKLNRTALDDRTALRALFELRRIIEVRAAMLAALRRDADDLRAMGTTLVVMRKADGWERATVDADLRFHLAVADAAGNVYIAGSFDLISERMRESIVITRAGTDPAGQARLAYKEHQSIYACIEAQDMAGAGAAMHRHLVAAARRLNIEFAPDALAAFDLDISAVPCPTSADGPPT